MYSIEMLFLTLSKYFLTEYCRFDMYTAESIWQFMSYDMEY